MSRLLESRRLVLVLDLDHTLVNSVKFSEVDAEWEYRLEQTVAEQVGVGLRAVLLVRKIGGFVGQG
jgi:hypothetical protein